MIVQILREPRFPDARLPDDRDEPGRAVVQGAREQVVKGSRSRARPTKGGGSSSSRSRLSARIDRARNDDSSSALPLTWVGAIGSYSTT